MNAFLPNGIKVGKKRIKIDGVGDELISTLFDSTSVIGKSFDNIVQKYNFHINDDALVLLKIGEVLIKGIKIENADPEPDPLAQSTKHHSLPKSTGNQLNYENYKTLNRQAGTIGINDVITTAKEDNYSDDSEENDEEEDAEEEDE